MRKAALVIAMSIVAGCAPNVVTEPHEIAHPALCTPAPVPSPHVMLVSPIAGATGVSTTTSSITISADYGPVSAIGISPAVGGTTSITNVTATGTTSNGENTYSAPLPGTLATGTTYTISATVIFDPTGCPQTFVVTAGSFST